MIDYISLPIVTDVQEPHVGYLWPVVELKKTLRVLFVTPLYPPYTGGASVYFDTLTRNIKRYVEPILITSSCANNSIKEVRNGVQVYRLIPAGRKLVGSLRIFLWITTSLFWTLFISAYKQVDLIHVHSSSAITIGTLLASKISRKPVVLDVRDLQAFDWIFRLGNLKMNIVTGKAVEKSLIQRRIESDRILLLPTILGLEKPPSQLVPISRPERVKEILYVGELIQQKGIRELLAAFKIVSGSVGDIKLTVVGGGPETEYCRQFIKNQGMNNIVMTGPLEHSKALELIANCYLLVLPSKSEANPTVIVEALSFGKPVIATNVGGVTEMVENGHNGIIVDNDNPKVLAQALTRLLTDENLAFSIGQNAKKMSLNQPTWEDLSRKISAAYVSCSRK